MRGGKVDGRVKKMEGEVFCEKEWKFFKRGLFFFWHDKAKAHR